MASRLPVVRIRGLTKTYQEAGTAHIVLRDVDLDVQEGDCVALLGRSGSGKSTLLNLVAGIDEADSGEVAVAERSITGMSDRERTLFRRSSIGFVYQFFNLIATLTVLENVRLPLDLADRGDGSAAARTLLEQVGLAGRERSYPDRLSGGEQQRVAIARALAAEPLLVLADEPTGNLDADTGDSVLRLLSDLTRARGRTLIVATHSRAVASAADVVYRIEDGLVVPIDAHNGTDGHDGYDGHDGSDGRAAAGRDRIALRESESPRRTASARTDTGPVAGDCAPPAVT